MKTFLDNIVRRRRFRYLIAISAILVLSAAATLFVVYGVGEEANSLDNVTVAPPLVVLNPQELFLSASGSEATSNIQMRDSGAVNLLTVLPPKPVTNEIVTVYPQWATGNSHVEDAAPITRNGNYNNPQWSPVGTDIAFASADGNAIYVVSPNSKNDSLALAPLWGDKNIAHRFSWAPDGMSILITKPDGQVYRLFLSGEITLGDSTDNKVWEQDGAVWWQRNEVEKPLQVSGMNDYFTNPILSPDGTKVVFSGKTTGLYIAGLGGAESGRSEAICVGRGQNPSWVFDSRGIVYDVAEQVGNSVIDGDLWFASCDGKERTNITSTIDMAESKPVISSDGERIAFVSDGAIYVGKFVRYF